MFGLFRGQKRGERNFILGRKVIPSRFQLLIVADSRVAIRRDPRKFNRASSSPVNLDPANRNRGASKRCKARTMMIKNTSEPGIA